MGEEPRRQEVLGGRVEEHIFVEPELVNIRPVERKGRRRRWGARKSRTPVSTLKEEAEKVYKTSMQKGRIIPDPSMYFVITFSDNFRSPIIRKVVQDLELDLVETTSDNIAKVRILKEQYQSFVRNLEKKAVYVESIRESTLQEKVEQNLLEVIRAEPEKRVR